jgi:N-acetylglucosaminyldiphosphoundecaprenol N-acetyl-beta-D-mannosaminyltransferase
MPRVADVGRDSGLRHFLFGSTPAIGARVEHSLKEHYPGVEIVGRLSPPFSTNGPVDPSVIAAIANADPDVVWCALGAPKQELWMNRAAPLLPGTLLLGVGAAFDFLASTKQRAPRWMRDNGLEWAHRLASEPQRLAGRYLTTNSSFMVHAGAELTRRRLGM